MVLQSLAGYFRFCEKILQNSRPEGCTRQTDRQTHTHTQKDAPIRQTDRQTHTHTHTHTHTPAAAVGKSDCPLEGVSVAPFRVLRWEHQDILLTVAGDPEFAARGGCSPCSFRPCSFHMWRLRFAEFAKPQAVLLTSGYRGNNILSQSLAIEVGKKKLVCGKGRKGFHRAKRKSEQETWRQREPGGERWWKERS